MIINRSLRFCGVFALALMAISIVPTSASAQAYRGKFTLPFSARWGGLTLTPGDYSFSADSLTPTSLISIQRDGNYLGSVMVGGVSYDAPTAQSALVAVPTGDAYRINTLRLEHECVITFQIPKRERRQMSARINGPELSRLVTVTASQS